MSVKKVLSFVFIILLFLGCSKQALYKSSASENLKTNGIYKLTEKSIDLSKLPLKLEVLSVTKIKIIDKKEN